MSLTEPLSVRYRETYSEEYPELSPAAVGILADMLALGRLHGPDLLLDAYRNRALTDGDLRVVLPDVWSMAEYPERALWPDLWVRLWRRAGFVSEAGAPAPTEPMVLHRGSTWGRRRGMAWTTDRTIAERFAYTLLGRLPGDVYTVTVEPDAVLAFIDAEDGRKESEVIVDPAMLPPVRRPRRIEEEAK